MIWPTIAGAFFALSVATSISAQTADLTTLPAGFEFVARSDRGETHVRYLGPDGDLFKFEFLRPNSTKGKRVSDIMWVNRESQTVHIDRPNGNEIYTPHDCAPSLVECSYHVRWNSGSEDDVLRTVNVVGDVQISREYLLRGGKLVLWNRNCITYDQYGFWIDAVTTYFDNKESYSRRVSSSYDIGTHTSFDELRKICEFPPELLS